MSERIIVLKKNYNSSDFFWDNLLKMKKIENLSVDQIINKYQGFEGSLSSFFIKNNNDFQIKINIENCLKLKKTKDDSLLFIISDKMENSSILYNSFIFMGYDVGICEKEKTIFSSIINEILFGFFEELIEYKNLLNDHLLFSDKIDAEKYLRRHKKLSMEQKGVEDYETLIIYEVWKYRF